MWVRELSDHSDRLSTAISCVDSAKGRVGQLHNQLTRETVVMEEKIKVAIKMVYVHVHVLYISKLYTQVTCTLYM